MSELLCLELSVVLWFVYLFTQILTSRGEFGDAYLFSPRDNYIENWVPFVAVDLALIATHHAGSWGAWIWVIARLVYLPAYVLGWIYVRTALWAIGLIGLLMMLVRLAGA